jgi:hypothetical protein
VVGWFLWRLDPIRLESKSPRFFESQRMKDKETTGEKEIQSSLRKANYGNVTLQTKRKIEEENRH